MVILRIGRLGVVLGAAALAACGGNNANVTGSTTSGSGGTATTGTGGMGGAAFVPAKHPALPQVRDLGGTVLKAPKLQPIRYSTDPDAVDLDKFFQELASSSYWATVTSEYGVGPLTVLPTIVRTDAVPTTYTDDQAQADIASNTMGASPPWGAADPSTIYFVLVPAGVTFTTGAGQGLGTGCKDFDGYHDEMSVGALTVPYAVGVACPGYDGPTVTPLEERTIEISHEVVEASTDPFPNTAPAYAQPDNADIVWVLEEASEVADMCEFNMDANVIPPGNTYTYQRSWSNKAAKANTNPCVPVVIKEPYFNSYPVLPDTVDVDLGVLVSTPGVKIAVGATQTIDINLFSDAPTSGPWKVTVYDGAYLMGSNAELELTLDKDTGENGDTLHLTIKVLAADPEFGVESFVLFSDLGGAENIWMGTVGQ
jgi:hypothetical protein